MFERVIAETASLRRNALAYIDATGALSFRQMSEDIDRCADWLVQAGVKPGQRVILHLGSVYRHWVLFFALETIGAISVATWDSNPLKPSVVKFVDADFYLTHVPPAQSLDIEGKILDHGWLGRLRKLRQRPQKPRRRTPDDPICIVLSSGTTGIPKKILFTRALIDTRLTGEDNIDLIHSNTRMLLMLPVISIGALTTSLTAWMRGALLCIKLPEISVTETLTRFQPTLIVGAPTHFSQIIDGLSADFVPAHPIEAGTGGGTLPFALAERMHSRLQGGIRVIYGSTEMGYVTRGNDPLTHDQTAVGFVLDSIEVAIRDERGALLDAGETGQVWVRGPAVIDEYLDEVSSGSTFEDGWFHPGDLGSLRWDGMLSIHGRTDEVMNFRGVKMLPSALEAAVIKTGLVHDVAAFMATPPGSHEALPWIVCAAEHRFPLTEVAKSLAKVPRYGLAFVDEIPRNAMGKIERLALRSRAEAGEFTAEWTADGGVQGRNQKP